MRSFATMLLLFLALPTFAADPKAEGKPNRLATEVSPYLLQHARNPVDWFPWGPEAFAKAKKENKLVFLSIGYSACHWCHVMERESFSNAAIAKQMNENFVCIKVDREERPDIDEIYMTSLQVLRTSGGWPLSMFLTAEAKPIFGGTYWPPEDRKTMAGEAIPGFKSVLAKVLELDKTDHKALLAQADQVAELVTEQMEKSTRDVALLKFDKELVTEAADAFEFDPLHGGFGMKANLYRGTKFPRAAALSVVLRRGPDKKPVHHTLEKMATGGIYDHLGGGFHRYSTERTWTVPHFEKMLYDNAQLTELYADAYAMDPKPEYKRVIAETLEFIAREMTAPEGGFYSALDADSNEKEGEFYVWTTKELDTILGTDAADFKGIYGAEKPNFEEKFHILRLAKSLTDAEAAKVAPLKAKLFAVRAKRERPFLDTKVLAGWNGQMIAGYARAGQVLKEPKYTATAEKAATFVLEKMRTKEGRLLRMYAGQPGAKPSARGTAFLEDYAYLTHGFLLLHDATGNAKWLAAAREMTDIMLKFFPDAERGGFYMTPDDGEKLFARGKDYYDGAQPSGNGMAARNLARLWIRTKDEKYKVAADKAVKNFAPLLRSSPTTAPQFADALGLLLDSAK